MVGDRISTRSNRSTGLASSGYGIVRLKPLKLILPFLSRNRITASFRLGSTQASLDAASNNFRVRGSGAVTPAFLAAH